MATVFVRPSLASRVALLLFSVLALVLPACGGGGGGLPADPGTPAGTCASGGGPPITISGDVRYERLQLSLLGLGPLTEWRPARRIDVEVRAAGGGTCYGRTSTDASGAYSFVVQPPAGASIEVAVFSRTLDAANHDIIVHDANPPFTNTHAETNVFDHESAPFLAANAVVDIDVPYGTGGDRPSVGFGLLDTLVTCWDRLRAVGATPGERLHAYTRLGNNGSLGTSYYSHSTRSLAILGGAAGLEDDSDTDYFDDAVVAHEFMHFVDKLISHNMSRGGAHSGELLEPAFAWSEGMATGFGCLLLQSPHYMDSSKTDATKANTVRFYTNAENATAYDPPGIGSEFTVAEVVWDCADGDAGADTDSDGVDTPFGDLVDAIASFDPFTDGPYLGLFLSRLEAGSATITPGGLSAFLAGGPENQGVSYPPSGDDVWPKAITVGGAVATGELTSDVANPCRALDASHWYQFTLNAAAVVTIDLTVIGVAPTADNLNMYLFNNQEVNFAVASSTNLGGANESIFAPLGAGTYILRVEASCLGTNHAQYELEIK